MPLHGMPAYETRPDYMVTTETQEGQTHTGLECCQQPPNAFPDLPLNLSSPQVNLSAPSFRENKEEGKDKKLVLSVGRGG